MDLQGTGLEFLAEGYAAAVGAKITEREVAAERAKTLAMQEVEKRRAERLSRKWMRIAMQLSDNGFGGQSYRLEVGDEEPLQKLVVERVFDEGEVTFSPQRYIRLVFSIGEGELAQSEEVRILFNISDEGEVPNEGFFIIGEEGMPDFPDSDIVEAFKAALTDVAELRGLVLDEFGEPVDTSTNEDI